LKALEKDFVIVRKLRALVSASAFVGNSEVRDEFDRRNTKVKFEYAVITQADILKGLHPTDEELKAFYERNKVSYNNSIPEKRQIKYVVVDSAKMAAATTVTDQDLQVYYDQHRDEYRVPEQVKVSHILIKTPLPAPGAKENEESRRRCARESRRRIERGQGGRRFLPSSQEKYSDDPGSAKNGGQLGWIRPRRTVLNSRKPHFSLGQRTDQRPGQKQLRLPHHPRRRQAGGSSQDALPR